MENLPKIFSKEIVVINSPPQAFSEVRSSFKPSTEGHYRRGPSQDGESMSCSDLLPLREVLYNGIDMSVIGYASQVVQIPCVGPVDKTMEDFPSNRRHKPNSRQRKIRALRKLRKNKGPESFILYLRSVGFYPSLLLESKKLLIFSREEFKILTPQCGHIADDEASDSSEDEKEIRSVLRLKKLNLSRYPSRPHACIDYLRRRNLISQFRMACETPSARDYFLKTKIDASWRSEIRACMYHRIDVSMDKLIHQSGPAFALGFLTGAAAGSATTYSAVNFKNYVVDRASMIRTTSEKLKREMESAAKSTGLFVVRFMVSTAQVYTAFLGDDPSTKLLAIMQMSLLAGEVYLTSWMAPLIAELKNLAKTIKLQAGTIMKTPLLKALLDILSKVVSCSFFPKVPDAARFLMTAALKIFTEAIEGADLLASLTKAFSTIVTQVQAFVSSGNLSDLFGKDQESTLMAELDAMESDILGSGRNDLVATSTPRIMAFRARVEEIRVLHLGDKSLQSPIFTSKLAVVRELVLMFLRNTKAQRKEPIGLIFSGDPGTGKTTYTDIVCDIVRSRHDIPSNMGVCWTYQSTKHQTIPSVVLVVQINDAFQTKDEVEPMLPLLQSLVDKTIVKAEGASLREKEISAVEPEIVMVSTNQQKYFFSTACGDVSKLMRRYYLVVVHWNDVAKKLALDGNYDVARTWEIPSNATRTDLVDYWFGEPSAEKQTIFFDVAHMQRAVKFSTLDALSRHIYLLYAKKMERGDLLPVRDMCKHGVTTKASCAAHSCSLPRPVAVTSFRLPEVIVSQAATDCNESDGIDVDEEGEEEETLPASSREETPVVRKLVDKPLRFMASDDDDDMEFVAITLSREEPTESKSAVPVGFDEFGFPLPTVENEKCGDPNAYYYFTAQADDFTKSLDPKQPTIIGQKPTPVPGFSMNSGPLLRSNLRVIGTKIPGFPNSDEIEDEFEDFGVPADLPRGKYMVAIRGIDLRVVLIDEFKKGFMIPINTPAESYVAHHALHRTHVVRAEGPYSVFPQMTIIVDDNPEGPVKIKMFKLWSFETLSPLFVGLLANVLTVVLAYQLSAAAYKWVFATPQAIIGGEVANIPNVHNEAEVIVRKHIPWLGSVSAEKTLTTCTGSINFQNSNLHFAVYCPGIIVFPKHLVDYAKENSMMTLTFDSGFVVQELFSKEKLYRFEADVCFYFTGEIAGSYVGIEPALSSQPVNTDELRFRGKMRRVEKTPLTDPNITVSGVETVVGDCGELYYSGNTIMGMHVGIFEFQRQQVCVRITKAMGELVKTEFTKRGYLMTPQCLTLPAIISKLCTTTDQKMGRSDMFFLNERATHQESVLSGMVPVGSLPGRNTNRPTCHKSTHYEAFKDLDPCCAGPNMGHAKLIDGMYVSAVTKRFRSVPSRGIYSVELSNIVLTWYTDQFGVGQNGLLKPLSPLSLYTALVGHPNNDLIGAKALEKAVGFDLKVKGLHKSKAFIFDPIRKAWVIDPRVVEEIDSWREAIDNDTFKPMIVEASVKDEVLLQTQVDKGKARLFYVPPMAYNILMKQYFAPIVAHLYSRPEISGMYCAINPVSSDWDELVRVLLKYGKKIFEGDQSGFDNKHDWIFYVIALLLYRLMIRLGYSKEDTTFAIRLFMRAKNYIVVVDNAFYFANDKMFSGVWITLFFNCLATIILTRMANALASGRFTPEEAFVATVGDDLLMAMSESASKSISPNEFADSMREMGYLFTPSSKDESELRYRDISEATFLKRDFHFEEGRWKARLAKSSLFKTLCYSLSTKDDKERDKSAFLSVLHEAVLWGKDFFEDIRARGVLLDYAPPTYEVLHQQFLTGSFRTWELEKPVIQEESDYHVDDDVNQTKEMITRQSKDDNIKNEGEGTVPLSGFKQSPTERNLDKSSGTGLEIVPTSNVTTMSVVEEDVTFRGSSAVDLLPNQLFAPISGFWERKRRVGMYTISASTSLNATFDPMVQLLTIPAVLDMFLMYYGYKADVVFTFIYTGSTNSYGMVRVSAKPPAFTDDYSPTVTDLQNGIAFADWTMTSTRPHIDLNMSEACTCELRLPYPSAKSFMKPTDPSWTLTITELLPLANVNGLTPNDINLEVWMSFENMQLFNMIQQSGVEAMDTWSNLRSRAERLSRSFSSAVNTPVVQALTTTTKALLALTLQHPPLEPAAVMVARPNVNTASTHGADMAFHIAQDELTQTNSEWSQFPLGSPDDMDLAKLREKWGQIRLNWQVGSANPIECSPGQYTSSSGDLYFTPLAFFTAPFAFWRGSLDYRIEVFTSPLVRWRFGIAVTIPDAASYPVTFPTSGDVLTHEVEVSGSTVYEFTVKYAQQKPFTATAFSSATSAGYPNLVLFSLMTPTGPSATVPLPYVNVYVKAGSDFEAAVPTTNFMSVYTPQSKMDHVPQSGAADVFGLADSNSLKNLLMTKTPHLSLGMATTAAVTTVGNFAIPADGLQKYENISTLGTETVKVTVDTHGPTYRNWLGKAFIGYNGGTSMSIMTCSNNTFEIGGSYGVGFNAPGYGYPQFAKKFQAAVQCPSVAINKGVADMTYPSKNPGRFKTSRGSASSTPQTCLSYRTANVLTPTNTTTLVYCGGADDIIVGGFTGIPKINFF